MHNPPDALVLCGGAGLRLRSVIGESQKGMASVGGRPFLELLLRQLSREGFKRVILAVGYQQESVFSYFGDNIFDLQLLYSPEQSALGTGGALRNAAKFVESEIIVGMNGDSYTEADLNAFVADYRASGAEASLMVVRADGRDDCGSVCVSEKNRIVSFDEKPSSRHAHYSNAGIYMLPVPLLYHIPEGRPVSLEREIFPLWLSEGRKLQAFVSNGACVDIGTPERYELAQRLLAPMERSGLTGGEEYL